MREILTKSSRLFMLLIAVAIVSVTPKQAVAEALTNTRASVNPDCYFFTTASGINCGYRCKSWAGSYHLDFCN